jgi:small subunit ribosomal protein S21
MIEIILEDGDKIDYALKSFKRKVLKSGLLREIRARQHYVKPSEARKLKRKASQSRKRRPPPQG